ncbi:hypothetical protein [Mesorhizobium sp. 128a]
MLFAGSAKSATYEGQAKAGADDMADRTVAELRQKIAQAREVIAHLMDKAAFDGAEAHRALDYFGSDAFEKDFLPWPHHGNEGLRPEELNAANDD